MTDELRDPLWDDEPSEDELAEAAALARALERETVDERDLGPLLPALEAGHLLQMARAPELSEARLEALFTELEQTLPAALPSAPVATGVASWWRRLRAGLVLMAGASAALVFAVWLTAREPEAPRLATTATTATTLPRPSVEVLEAQLSAAQRVADGAGPDAGGAPLAAQPLARAMRPYRAELLAQLATEYTP